MALPSRPRPQLVTTKPPTTGSPRRQVNLSDLAYARIEELLVCCELKPGRFLATHDLQTLTGLGRTPVHQAVNRLATDTLVIVSPRHGIQIAPIDLTRERLLLQLRRDVERFVIRLAAERSGASQRNQMLHIKRHLIERGMEMTMQQFNVADRRIDQLFLTAAHQPFVESSLRPLHTIFRRVSWIYHRHMANNVRLQDAVDLHIAVIDGVASGDVDAAISASERLMDFVDSMLDVLEREVAPTLLDCSLDSFDDTAMILKP